MDFYINTYQHIFEDTSTKFVTLFTVNGYVEMRGFSVVHFSHDEAKCDINNAKELIRIIDYNKPYAIYLKYDRIRIFSYDEYDFNTTGTKLLNYKFQPSLVEIIKPETNYKLVSQVGPIKAD